MPPKTYKTPEELNEILNKEQVAFLIKAQKEQLSLTEQNQLKDLRDHLSDDYALDELPSVEILEQVQKMHKKPTVTFEGDSVDKNVLADIIKDFEEQYGKEKNKNGMLEFSSYEEVNTFFKGQADKGRAFLMQEANKDNYVFSDGKGHYLMGSKAEIADFCEKNKVPSPFGPEKSLEEDKPRSMAYA